MRTSATSSKAQTAQPMRSSRERAEAIGIGIIVVLVGWFYFWTAFPIPRGEFFPTKSLGYYNLQAAGFLKGQLSLDAEVDPFILTLKNPWDPVARAGHGPHDATYFNGRYYMYFGPTPALILYLPLKLLTGHGIAEDLSSVVFSCIGFLCAATIVCAARRRYFPRIGTLWLFSCIVAVGLVTMIPSLLRRPSIWEVPITGAYACGMAALLCLYCALHRSSQRMLWLALSSLLIGLAVGSRPVYVLACAGLLIPLIKLWLSRNPQMPRDESRSWRSTAAAAVLPALLVGIGLAWYNYARFGSILEFGQKYQLAGDDVTQLKLFDPAFTFYALHLYFLSPAGWTPYFPFLTVINPPPPPPGQFGVEDPYGILPNMPFIFAALGLFLWASRSYAARKHGPLGEFAVIVTVISALVTVTVASFGGVTNRYMVDFLPGLTLLACLGSFTLFDQSWMIGYRKVASAAVMSALLIFSVGFNVLVSMQHNELLRIENPPLYGKVAHAANYLSYLVDRATGTKYAPIEMKVVFPKREAGAIEAFLTTGTTFRSDYIYLHYLGENLVRFGFEHTSHGGFTGDPVLIKPGEVQVVRIDLGSLYPPAQHPFYDKMARSQARVLQRLVQVTVDEKVVLHGRADCYDASSRTPSIGTSDGRPGFTHPFSGKLLSWRRAKEKRPQPQPLEYGMVRLELTLPAFTGVKSEPLLSSGETGSGDLIYIRYLGNNSATFGHDDWGAGALTSAPFELDFAIRHVVEIDYGALYPATAPAKAQVVTGKRTVIRVDGKVAMDSEFPYYPCEPDTITVGSNAIGASSATPAFSGVIQKSERVPSP